MVSVSPIFTHLTETVTGSASIRASNAQARFIQKSGIYTYVVWKEKNLWVNEWINDKKQ